MSAPSTAVTPVESGTFAFCMEPESLVVKDSPDEPANNSKETSSVRVAVRVRPSCTSLEAHSSHVVLKDSSCLTLVCPSSISSGKGGASNAGPFSDLQASSAVIAAASDILWQFDSVWGEKSDQNSLFKVEVLPLVEAFVQGFNTTGQTGSGKTYTMGTCLPDIASSSVKKEKFRPSSSGRSTPTPSPRGNSASSACTTPSKVRLQPLVPSQLSVSIHSSLASAVSAIADPSLSETSGMIPRAIHEIFQKLSGFQEKQESQLSSHVVTVSFLELHNEEWIDLLKDHVSSSRASSGGPPGKKSVGTPTKAKHTEAEGISLREDKEGKISVHGATSVVVSCPEAALMLLAKGSKLRSTAATQMNESSSRSHAIFSVSLSTTTTNMGSSQQQWHPVTSKSSGVTITSKFHFVDLAGSERLKRTQNTGDRKTEGISINQGLLVLGRVINSLTESKTASIPYRDSKLTRFLQDSLGGNSKTVMLACISGQEEDLPETINTLRYASRARGIENKSRITIDTSNSSPEILPLLSQIANLKGLLVESNLLRAADQETILSLQAMIDERKNLIEYNELRKKLFDIEVEKQQMRQQLVAQTQLCDEHLIELSELKSQKMDTIDTALLQSVIQNLESQNKCLAATMQEIAFENSNLKLKNEQLDETCSLLEISIQDLNNSNLSISNEKSHLESLMIELRAKLEDTERKITESSERENSLVCTNHLQAEQLTIAEKKKINVEMEMQTLQRNLQIKIDEMAEQLKEAQQMCNDLKEKNDADKTLKGLEIETLTSRITILESEKALIAQESEEVLGQIRHELSLLTVQHEESMKSQANEWEVRVQQCNKNLNLQLMELADAKSEITISKSMLSDSEGHCKILESQLILQESRVSQLTADLESLSTTKQTILEDSSILKSNIQSLQSTIESLVAQKDAAHNELTECQHAKQESDRKLAAATQKLLDLESNLKGREFKDAQTPRLRLELEKAHEEIRTLQMEMQQIQQQKNAETTELQTLRKLVETLKLKLNTSANVIANPSTMPPKETFGHVVTRTVPGDDMFERWCKFASKNPNNEAPGGFNLVKRRIAEYNEERAKASVEMAENVDASLVDRFRFLSSLQT